MDRYEDGSHNANAGMHRRPGSIAPVRRRRETDSSGAALHNCATRTCVPKASGSQSTSARPEAEGQAFRFPLPCRLAKRRFSDLASEFGIGEPLANDLTNSEVKALTIGHVSIVESERLLIQVPEQVERLHAHIGATQAALQQAPEVLHTVSVDLPVDVLDGMVNYLMLEFVQALIGLKGIGIESGPSLNVLPYFRLKSAFLAVRNYGSANPAALSFLAAFQDSHDGGLVFPASAGNLGRALGSVHVARSSADEGFVRFDFSPQFPAVLALLGKPDAMEHKPRGLLSDSKRPCDLTTGDAILAIQDEPHSWKPLIQTERRILENGPNLDGELPPGMPDAALPAKLILEEPHASAATDRADHAVSPFGTAANEVVQAVLGDREVNDCFLKCLGFAFHASIVPQNRVLVKYIFTLISATGGAPGRSPASK